jgi:hypothetical protein
LIGIALHSTATAQATASAGTSPTTLPVSIDVCQQRLDKALDAYEKAIAVIGAKDNEIAARKALDDLRVAALAIKDQMIADLMADNTFLRKQVHPSKSALRQFFEKVEKILIFAAGAYVGSL